MQVDAVEQRARDLRPMAPNRAGRAAAGLSLAPTVAARAGAHGRSFSSFRAETRSSSSGWTTSPALRFGVFAFGADYFPEFYVQDLARTPIRHRTLSARRGAG